MAFPLHLLERVAVDTGGSLGNSRHGTERLAAGGLVDPDACRAYATKAEAKLDKRLANE